MTQYAHPEWLAETDWLATHLGEPGIRILDCRRDRGLVSRVMDLQDPRRLGQDRPATDLYRQAHVPGAAYLDIYRPEMTDASDPTPGNVAPPQQFAALMGGLGIGDGHTVVLYDGHGNFFACRVWWALRYYGHNKVKVLNGGFTKWSAEKRPTRSGDESYPPATFTPRVQPGLRVDLDRIRVVVGDPSARRAASIIDARPPARYRGEVVYDSKRGGHVPGAVNVPWEHNLNADMTFKSADDLAAMYADLGIRPGQQVYTYCGRGTAAAGIVFILRLLGHDRAATYDSGLAEWGNREDTPVENG